MRAEGNTRGARDFARGVPLQFSQEVGWIKPDEPVDYAEVSTKGKRRGAGRPLQLGTWGAPSHPRMFLFWVCPGGSSRGCLEDVD